ncbi:MAG: NAD(+)/NADH kinase [Candidatus Aenigmarchaeota archaeon]|nr:NAD(+)/NADH kinase [Candidatus Aenigmarchaeota archaeon]
MRFIVRTKNGYGGSIRDEVVRMLEANGEEHTDRIEPGCDFAVIIGGDGTLLRDHSWIDCPVLGINPGRSVGFYMRACNLDFRRRLMSLLHGRPRKDYYIYDLMRLQASVNGHGMDALALNEVLVSPVFVRRIMEAELEVGGRKSLERNSAIIAYTPTGSNAFARSAGAKPLSHGSKSFGVVALAPYSGSLKRGEKKMRDGYVRIRYSSDKGEVCIDGSELHLMELRHGDVVEIGKHPKPLRLVGFRPRLG